MDLNFFVHSVLGPSNYGGYGLHNAPILWGLFLLFYYFLYLFLKKSEIKINFKLVFSLIPFFIFGTIVRTFTDSGLLPYTINPLEIGFYTHSPGLWMGIFFLIIGSLFVAKKLFKNDYLKIFALFGTLLMLVGFVPLVSVGIDFAFLFSTIILVGVVSAIVILIANRFVVPFKGDYLNYLAVIGQVIDGVVTVLIVSVKNCGEQHFVSRGVLSFSPILFPILKIALILAALYLIDTNMKNGNKKNFVKLVLIALAFMTGPRNLWTASIGTCG